MNRVKQLLLVLPFALIAACTSDNLEDLYDTGDNTGPEPVFRFTLDSTLDAVKGNKSLTAFGAPVFAEGMNGAASALSLDGSDDYLEVNIGSLDTFSILIWYKASAKMSTGKTPIPLFDYADQGLSANLGIDAKTQATILELGKNQTVIKTEGTKYLNCSHDWNSLYLGATLDGLQMGYVAANDNGLEISRFSTYNATGAVEATTTKLLIGKSSDAGISFYFSGLVDEIRIYDQTLTDNQIRTIFTQKELNNE